jgi:hypothetical protein
VKRLTLLRDQTCDEGTFSIGMLNDGEQRLGWWNFIELPWRDNAAGISCVTEGLYIAKPFDSPHFKRMVYRLQNIPEREDVEMHPANWAGDKALGYYCQLRGCMAPGTARGSLMTPPANGEPGMMQKAVLNSGIALDEIFKATGGEDIEIEIAWEAGVKP